MVTKERPYHLVVFGASGFTGQFVAQEVAREQVVLEQSSRLPWAVAGRSREKLQRVLERAALKLGKGAEEGSGVPLGPGVRVAGSERLSFGGGRRKGSSGRPDVRSAAWGCRGFVPLHTGGPAINACLLC